MSRFRVVVQNLLMLSYQMQLLTELVNNLEPGAKDRFYKLSQEYKEQQLPAETERLLMEIQKQDNQAGPDAE